MVVRSALDRGERLREAAWILVPVAVVLVLDLWLDFLGAPVWAKVKVAKPETDLALGALSVLAAHAAEPRAVLERFLTGVAATPLRDLTIEQDLTVFNPEGRAAFVTGTQRVVVKLPDIQRVEQTLEGRREVRLTVRGRSWRRAGDGPVTPIPPEGGQTIALAVPLHRSVDEVLAEWRTLGVRDDRSHEARMGGRTVTVIGAQAGERDRPAAWIDPEYGIVRFVAREPITTGSVLTDVVFSDYRPLLGPLFFPHRQETFRSGKLILRLIARSVAVNTSPPESLFDPAGLK
jgi:hypothetical protein